MRIDLTTLRTYLPAAPVTLFATVSGAHLDGFESADVAADTAGLRAVIVDEPARRFYQRYGFESFPGDPLRLALLDSDEVAPGSSRRILQE